MAKTQAAGRDHFIFDNPATAAQIELLGLCLSQPVDCYFSSLANLYFCFWLAGSRSLARIEFLPLFQKLLMAFFIVGVGDTAIYWTYFDTLG